MVTLIKECEEGPDGFEDSLNEAMGGPDDSPTQDMFECLSKKEAAKRVKYFTQNTACLAECWVKHRVFQLPNDSLLMSKEQQQVSDIFFDSITSAADQFPLFNELDELKVQDVQSLSEGEKQTIMDKLKPYCNKISEVLNDNIKEGFLHCYNEGILYDYDFEDEHTDRSKKVDTIDLSEEVEEEEDEDEEEEDEDEEEEERPRKRVKLG
jgi:transcription elongation factor Elf1